MVFDAVTQFVLHREGLVASDASIAAVADALALDLSRSHTASNNVLWLLPTKTGTPTVAKVKAHIYVKFGQSELPDVWYLTKSTDWLTLAQVNIVTGLPAGLLKYYVEFDVPAEGDEEVQIYAAHTYTIKDL